MSRSDQGSHSHAANTTDYRDRCFKHVRKIIEDFRNSGRYHKSVKVDTVRFTVGDSESDDDIDEEDVQDSVQINLDNDTKMEK